VAVIGFVIPVAILRTGKLSNVNDLIALLPEPVQIS
jgi:hypothetical protein